MGNDVTNILSKKVPSLYESDESKYVGPHRWQVQSWARLVRRTFRYYGYTRWLKQACSSVKVEGLQNLDRLVGPCIFVANHQSHVDTLVIDAAMPASIRRRLFYGAAQDRWFVRGKKKLVLRPWYQSLVLGTFPILRGGGRRALSYASWLLEHGENVFLFPEGTRSIGSDLGDFKHGASILAVTRGVPIVPIYISGLKSIRPKGAREVVKGAASVHFLEALYFDKNMDVFDATHLVRDRLLAVHRQFEGEELAEAA